MFPGYVLLNMVMNDDTWYVVRNTRGVTGFVGPGSKPVPLTEEEMLPLGIKNEDIQVDFAEGDIVVVTGGAWKDTTGIISPSTLRSRLLLSMLNCLAAKHRLKSVSQKLRITGQR